MISTKDAESGTTSRLAAARRLLARLKAEAKRVESETDHLRREAGRPQDAAATSAADVERLLTDGNFAAGAKRRQERASARARLDKLDAELALLRQAGTKQAEIVEKLEGDAAYQMSREMEGDYIKAAGTLADALDGALAAAQALEGTLRPIRDAGLTPSCVVFPVSAILHPATLAELRTGAQRARGIVAGKGAK